MPWTRILVSGVTRIDMREIAESRESGARALFLRDELDDLLGRVGHGIAADEIQTRTGQRGFAGGDVVALEANDERQLEADFLDRFDDARGDDVAIHDAAKNVNEDPFHVWISEDDLEGRDYLVLRSAAADIEEVRRFAAVVFDDVHRRHREAGAVDQTGNAAVERDVAERVF